VRDDAPKLGRIALHLDQGPAKRGLLLSLRQRLLEQAAEAVLLPLDPQEILNLLPRTRAVPPGCSKQRSRAFRTKVESGA
jgi:hypothetical protein